MEQQVLSTAMYSRKVIDCRLLSLNLEFYSFSKAQVFSLAEDTINWINSLLADKFVVRRMLEKKSISFGKELSSFKEHLQTRNYASYLVDAMVKSPVVYNVRTFRDYFRNLRDHLSTEEAGLDMGVSVDYPDYWNCLFPHEERDPKAFKEKLCRIFREARKIMKGYFLLPDLQALLHVSPYKHAQNQYFGCISIDMSAFCLNGHIDSMAEHFAKFATQLSNTYVQLNARVSLQPTTYNPYTRLFQDHRVYDGSHEAAMCTEHEWYRTYYAQGVEWFNAISPLTRQHFTTIPNSDLSRNMLEEGPSGNLFFKSDKTISSYDIGDALVMKQLLYPALMPGWSEFSYRVLFHDELHRESMHAFPRHDWAIVPVFEDEIYIVGRNVVLSSKC